MEVTERMGDSARDHECANERVPAYEKGKEKKRETRRSLDSPDAPFGAVSLRKSSRATIREFELAVLDLEKKKKKEHRTEQRHESARERRFVSHTSP